VARDSKASREKILAIAISMFARKGFDGARMDGIAKEANVNKALIYYYFKSKSMILEEIFKTFDQEASTLVSGFFQDQIDLTDTNWIRSFFDTYMDFLEDRKDILRIMITESLKSNDAEPPIFGFLKVLFQQESTDALINTMKQQGYALDDQKEQILVTEFFTDIIPIISYIVFKDKWSRFFDIDKQKLKDLFFEAYKSTHIAYHLSQTPDKITG